MDSIFEAILEIVLDILIIPLEKKARSKIIIISISIVVAIILFIGIYLICN